jgi:hypothetical protein
MLEDFPLEISQRLICLVGSMGTHVVMQEQPLCCWLSGPCETMGKCLNVQGDYVEK